MQLSCKPFCRGGRALLLQQGLFELSPGLVGKFQSHCPLVPTRTMAAGSEHRANRALSVWWLKAETLLQSLCGLEPRRRCLPEPRLSALPYKDGIDFCRPDPRPVQSSRALGFAAPVGQAGLSSRHTARATSRVPVALSRLSVALRAKPPRVTFALSSDAFDNELIVKTLKEITEGKTVQIPVYDFVSHSRSNSRSCLAAPLLRRGTQPCRPNHPPLRLCQPKAPTLTAPGLLVRGSEAVTGTVLGSGKLHGHVMPSSNIQAAVEEGYGPPPTLPLPIHCVCGCNKYSRLKHSCTARKRVLAALAPVTPPLHAFSLFLHACIGRHGVTLLLVLRKRHGIRGAELAPAGSLHAGFLGFAPWHVMLASSSWPRLGERGWSASCSAVCPFRKRTYAWDSLHCGGVGLLSPRSPPWCSSDVPGLEQRPGAPLFTPTPLGLFSPLPARF